MNLPASFLGNICWVCQRELGTKLHREDHHVIPRAYGGIDGPQVSLCDSHHSALHEIALKMYGSKPFYQFLSNDPNDVEINHKLITLATIVCNARLATENDPNKTQVLVLKLRREDKLKLAGLKKLFPKLNQNQVVLKALDELYRKHYVK